MVPSSRCLLEAVERLVEPADHIWAGGIGKSRGLTAVNCLSQSAMEESILDIQLMHRPGARASERTVRTVAGFTTGLNVSS